LGQAGPAGFFSSGISRAVQHMTQEPQALPGADAKIESPAAPFESPLSLYTMPSSFAGKRL
jgi:hypothetical protein